MGHLERAVKVALMMLISITFCQVHRVTIALAFVMSYKVFSRLILACVMIRHKRCSGDLMNIWLMPTGSPSISLQVPIRYRWPYLDEAKDGE